MGRKTQNCSIPFFAAMYAKQCIVFDRIFGWELQEQPAHYWWENIPPLLRKRVTFFNVGVAKEPWQPSHDEGGSVAGPTRIAWLSHRHRGNHSDAAP